MSDRPAFPFGEPNWEVIGRWLHLAPAEDGPVWMLNLMKYRAVAQYRDGRSSSTSGREADDAYSPLGPLAAVGASVALFADVVDQSAGEPFWDRVAMVRYPTRAAFFEMQERDDFKQAYPHKEAGMEFTIIMGCVPVGAAPTATPAATYRMAVRRFAGTAPPGGTDPVARFSVDGVVLGDQRRFDEVRLDRAEAPAAGTTDVAEQFVMTLRPRIDDLVASVAGAGG